MTAHHRIFTDSPVSGRFVHTLWFLKGKAVVLSVTRALREMLCVCGVPGGAGSTRGGGRGRAPLPSTPPAARCVPWPWMPSPRPRLSRRALRCADPGFHSVKENILPFRSVLRPAFSSSSEEQSVIRVTLTARPCAGLRGPWAPPPRWPAHPAVARPLCGAA